MSNNQSKNQIIKLIGIGAGVTTIVSSLVYFFMGRLIPGLSPLSLAVLVGVQLYGIHVENKREDNKLLFFILIVAFIISIISGIAQIVVHTK